MTTYTITAEQRDQQINALQGVLKAHRIQISSKLPETYADAAAKRSAIIGAVADAERAIMALESLQPNTQEPVGYTDKHGQSYAVKWSGVLPANLTLYAHPAPQKPLTVEQRCEIWDSVKYAGGVGWEVDFGDVCDAVEAAHNIGVQMKP